ncbi:MAG: YbjN domain-containing protein [Dermatophilaceae bacterium]
MSDPTALPSFPPPPDEHPLRGLVIDALQDLGLEPNVDKEGDVAFKANDQQMFVRCLESEVKIMRVFGQWQLADPVPQDKVMQLSVCNDINLSMTMVKTGIGNDALVVTSEHLVTDTKAVKNLVSVSVQITLATVQQWHERIMKLSERIAEQRKAVADASAGDATDLPGAPGAESRDAGEGGSGGETRE